MKIKFLISTFVGLAAFITAQGENVHIPDPNFKAYLLGHRDINKNGDGEISVAEAQAFTGDIECNDKNISDLTGIEAFVNIKGLFCSRNQLSSLDIGKNRHLYKLGCSGNQLSSLDVSNNTVLDELYCQDNQLRILDLSNNVHLRKLHCFNNQLGWLHVGDAGGLEVLLCHNNELRNLYLGNNHKLIELNCSNNKLISLDLKSGFNRRWIRSNRLDLTNTPDLRYIQVDDVAYSNAQWSGKKDATASFSENYVTPNIAQEQSVNIAQGPNVHIPDPNLKALLIKNSIINRNGDAEISVAEAQAFTGAIRCRSKNISDLTGIEAFVNIVALNCSSNLLRSLDVSRNTALTHLDCVDNQITSLDLSNNTYLTELRCYNNQLSSLDLSNNTYLTELRCDNNQLSSLDLSNNTDLAFLFCEKNKLSSLDLGNTENLHQLRCNSNQLTNLDVSKHRGLSTLYCGDNQLSRLDLSNNVHLVILNCNNNQLVSLNLKNGYNRGLNTFLGGILANNPNLRHIQVDDVAYSNAKWSHLKDATASFTN